MTYLGESYSLPRLLIPLDIVAIDIAHPLRLRRAYKGSTLFTMRLPMYSIRFFYVEFEGQRTLMIWMKFRKRTVFMNVRMCANICASRSNCLYVVHNHTFRSRTHERTDEQTKRALLTTRKLKYLAQHRFNCQVGRYIRPRSNLNHVIESLHATEYMLAIAVLSVTICEKFTMEMCMNLTFRVGKYQNISVFVYGIITFEHLSVLYSNVWSLKWRGRVGWKLTNGRISWTCICVHKTWCF